MKRVFILKGLDCPNCSAKIEKEVGALPGVESSVVNLMQQTLTVQSEKSADATLAEQVETIVHSHEPDVEVSEKTEPAVTKVYLLKGLDCPNCSAKIEKEVGELDGVTSSTVNLMNQTLTVQAGTSVAASLLDTVTTIVHSHEPDVEVSEKQLEATAPVKKDEKAAVYNDEDKKRTIRLAVGAVVYAIGMALTVFAKLPTLAELAFLIVAYVILGWDVVWQAVKNITRGQVFDEHFLMSVSTIGAFAIGEYPEAVAVILCIILFLPVTYTMRAIPGMMFLLGIYCAGGYGGSVSAILINTPGTPHAAATMLDGYPLSKMGRTKAALKIALYASTFGGIFSALVLLFLGPQVAKISAQLGTAEYFMVCLFGMTIIAGVSGKSLVKGIIAACLGLLISCVGADPMTSYDRFTFGIPRLYLGLDLAVTLIGLFALVEIIGKAELKRNELNLHAGKIGNDDGKITKDEYKRMFRPVLMGSIIGSCVGIVPGTGASEASWFSYNTAKNLSKHPEEFGHGSVEGVAAAESANNAVCGATLIPLLTLGIPGDGCVAIMLSALMINGLNPGLSLFTTDGAIMYAIMLGLILVNIFMFLQGKYLTSLFAKVVSIPQQILTPIIVIFCFAGAYSVNSSYFDLSVALVFGVMAWFMRKLELPAVPVLLGMVLGNMTETNFRRALLISDGSPKIFFSSVYCWIFIALIVVVIIGILRGKMKETKNAKVEQ